MTYNVFTLLRKTTKKVLEIELRGGVLGVVYIFYSILIYLSMNYEQKSIRGNKSISYEKKSMFKSVNKV